VPPPVEARPVRPMDKILPPVALEFRRRSAEHEEAGGGRVEEPATPVMSAEGVDPVFEQQPVTIESGRTMDGTTTIRPHGQPLGAEESDL